MPARTNQTTHLDGKEFVTITHPFHPRTGEECKIIGIRKSTNRKRLICQDADGNEVSVPIEHTNMYMSADSNQQSPESGCDFGYDELVELAHIINEIMC